MFSNVLARLDSWVNSVTGQGTARDKTAYGTFSARERLSDYELAALFYNNAIAKKAVRTIPRMIRRAGYTYSLSVNGKVDAKLHDQVEGERKRLALDGRMYDASVWGRLYGGAAILIVNPDKDLSKPLDEKAPGPISALTVLDRRYLRVVSRYADPRNPNFGLPELLEVLPEPAMLYTGPNEKGVRPPLPAGAHVHASRLVLFYGDEVDRVEAQMVEFWSYSVLQTAYDNLKNGDAAVAALGAMLLEGSISVFAIDGLIAALASNNKDALMRRMAASDLAKSAYRSVLIDAQKERFDRVGIQFGGVSDTATVVLQHVAAAFEMPMTVLFGTSPAGMNATGESDMRNWYDQVAGVRDDDDTPKRVRLLTLLAASLGAEASVSLVPGALWQMTDKERAELRASTAQSDKVYADMLAVEPQAVALARYRSGTYDPNAPIPINIKQLERELKPAPLGEEPPRVELAPTAYEAVLTKRMVLEMLEQQIDETDPTLDLTITEAKAKAAEPAPALPAAPALPSGEAP